MKILLALVALAGLTACTSPLATSAPPVKAPASVSGTLPVQLVIHPQITANRAVLTPDPTFLALRLIETATGQVQFGTGHNDGAGNYAVTNLGSLVPGKWTIRAFLYDDDATLTLLYSGGQELDLAAGSNTITLPVAAPGSLAGVTIGMANKPTGITLPVAVPAWFRAGQSTRLLAAVDGEVAASLALDQHVIWSSSNPALATVSAQGLATFKAAGTVTLTAKAAADETVTLNVNIQVVPALYGRWKPVYPATISPRVLRTVPHPLVIEGQGTTDAAFVLVATFDDSRVRGPLVGAGASATWRATEFYDYASAQWKPLTGIQPTFGGLLTSPNPVVTLDGVYQYLLQPWDDYQPVTAITLTPPGALSDLGTPVPLTIASTLPAAPSVGVYTYTSSNPNAVSVVPFGNDAGLMTLHSGAGSAVLRVTAVADPSTFAEVVVSHGQVTVLPPKFETVAVDTSGLPANAVFGLTSGPSTFTYHATSTASVASWAWVLDGAVVATSGAGASSDYTLDVKSPALALGPHSLSVEATAAGLVLTNDQTGNTLNFTVVNAVTPPVVAVSAGVSHTMVLKADGSLWATGDNSRGALGDGTFASRTTFEPVMTGVASVSAGYYGTLVIKTDGSLWGTGANSLGQLGDGTTTDRNTFEQLMTNVASVSAGNSYTAVIKTDGSLWMTGFNGSGQLGNGTNNTTNTFVQVLTGVTSVEAGDARTFIVKNDRTLWATGENFYGALGIGTNTNRNVFIPVQIGTGFGVASVTAGVDETAVVTVDGNLWMTGFNGNGALGDGTYTNRNAFGQVLTGNTPVVAAGEDDDFILIVKRDGSLWATGMNSFGQLGDGTNTGRNTFGQVLTNVASVSSGAGHTVVLKTDGSLWVTGYNGDGELGDGTNTDRNTFKRVM